MRPDRALSGLLLILFSGLALAAPPTLEQVLGRRPGERITLHHQMVDYLESVAAASDRVILVDQGRSWEGRKLLLAIVTAPENHARLESIRENARRLADPRDVDPAEVDSLLDDQPAVIWMGGSIHGFELSGSEGLLLLLEHLATRDDPATRAALRDTVVLIDPMLNPDGRDAFATLNHENVGRLPNPSRDDWANDFDRWQALKFRTGHYYFDTNRDWFAQTQPETRHRVRTLLAWQPQVVVDAHEMGADVEFYFDPPADPYGPYFPSYAQEWFRHFGRAYAEAFDAAGFEYMTRERYNYFYPGYTTSFGSYLGAVGMLYEQGSSRGLALHRADESVRRLGDAMRQQYTAAWTAVRLAAERRTELLASYHEAHRQAVDDGATGTRYYLFPPGGDPQDRAELVALLQRDGIEVTRLTEEQTIGGLYDRTGAAVDARRFPSGTFVVDAAQPRNRLIRTLLEPDQPLPESFLEEARARVDRGENPRFYDITAWSLPLMFDLVGFGTKVGKALPLEPVTGPIETHRMPSTGQPRYAYLIDGAQTASLSALYHLRAAGHRVSMLLDPTRIAGQDYASGTLIVPVGGDGPAPHRAVRELARRFGLSVDGVDSGLSEDGFPALGSGDVIRAKLPEIAILAGPPIGGYSFGWTWHTLDRQFEIPHTVRRIRSIAGTPIHRFNVIVIPDLRSAEALERALGERGVARLVSWVRDGGTLVTLGGAAEFVLRQKLVALRSWYEQQKPGSSGEEAADTSAAEPQRFGVPGAFFQATVDDRAWLGSGYDVGDGLPVLVNSSRLLLPPEGAPDADRRVVARYADDGSGPLSGFAWPETVERLPGTVFTYEERVDRGRVVVFTEDPNFRAYWRGAQRLFLNAVVLGPSAP